MLKMIKSAIKLLVVLAMTTLILAFVWEYTAGNLYDCTDGGLPGYLTPGYWVHSWEGHPVASVPAVTHGRSMSEPDILRQGWSVTALAGLWLVFFTASLVVSIKLARLRWFSEGQTHESKHGTNQIA